MNNLDRLAPGYLKKYADRYRVYQGEDGLWSIRTRHKPSEGIDYDVCVFDNTRLAALVPRGSGLYVLRTQPDDFVKHQEGEDGIVILFDEKLLDRLADVLHLKRRRRLSAEERQIRVERLSPFRFQPQVA